MDVVDSPLEPVWRDRGAEFETTDGVRSAVRFGDEADEVAAVRNAAGLVDLSDRAKLAVVGEAARQMLQGQITNDVAALEPGAGLYAAHLNPKGRMITDMILRCEASDRILLDLERSLGAPMLGKLARFGMLDDCEIEDITDAFAILLLAGPSARDVLAKLTPASSLDALPCHHFVAGEIAGRAVTLVADGETGEVGYRIWVAADAAAAVAEAILADDAVKPVGDLALDVLRLEAGVPRWGRDMTDANLPPECGIPHAISYTKGCYVGQETIARMKTYGQANKSLRGFASDVLLAPGTKLTDENGKEVGTVTSSAWSPTLDRPVALGYAHRSAAKPGTMLLGHAGHRPIETEVVALPFVPRRFSPDVVDA